MDYLSKFSEQEAAYKGVATNVVFAAKWILDHCGRTLKQYDSGLTVEQFNLLLILKAQYPKSCNINCLREQMLDKNSDVSRLVERLRRRGWVERHENERDRRVADVDLTNKGLDLLSRLEEEEKKWPQILSGISIEEARILNKILVNIYNKPAAAGPEAPNKIFEESQKMAAVPVRI